MNQQTPCIADDLSDPLAITALYQRSPSTRKTGSQGPDRDRKDGPASWDERSRPSPTCPRQRPAAVVAPIIEARRHHTAGGAKPRLPILTQRHPQWP
jgi:hypothetical protein